MATKSSEQEIIIDGVYEDTGPNPTITEQLVNLARDNDLHFVYGGERADALREALLNRLSERKHCVLCGAFGYSKNMGYTEGMAHRRGPCGEITCEFEAALALPAEPVCDLAREFRALGPCASVSASELDCDKHAEYNPDIEGWRGGKFAPAGGSDDGATVAT